MKRNTIFISVIIVITLLEVTNTYSDNKKSGRGYVILEVNHSDIGNLNTALQHSGYSRFSENITGIGVGGHDIRQNRIVFEGFASWYYSRNLHPTIDNIKYTSSLSGMLGCYNIGYLLYTDMKRNINVFPLVGLGFGGMKMTLNEREKRPFSDILESPRESVTDTGMMFLINIALGIDHLYVLKSENNHEKGLGAGIRIGYRYCFYNQNWPDITGNPEISFTGPYISLTLGGGYNKMK